MTTPICPETGTPMKRGGAPMTISYQDQSATFEMPGWYCDACDESTHTGADLKGSDRMLNRLKARHRNQRLVQPAATAGPPLS